MYIKWFPRSWIQIRTDDYTLCFDPSFLITNYKKVQYVKLSEQEDDYLPIGVNECDFIFITHMHRDHYKIETINRIVKTETVIFSVNEILEKYNERTVIVNAGDILTYPGMSIEVVNAYNTEDGASTKKVHIKGKSVGYILSIDNKRIYVSGDTDLIPEMRNIENIDVAFLPIGGTFTMDTQEVIECLQLIKPKYFVPVHHLRANPELLINLMPKNVNCIIPKINEEILI